MKITKTFCTIDYTSHELNRTQSKNHNIGSYRINKISMSPYSDKKDIIKDGYSRLSRFNKSTR